MSKKLLATITFDQLPEAREWKVGKKYHVQMVLRQMSMNEDSAQFEIIDATSMDGRAERSKHYLSGDGTYMG